jgi:O-antigen ligase
MRLDALLLALVAVAWLPANHYPPWLSAWQEGLAFLALGLGTALISRRASLPSAWALLIALALASVALQWATRHILFFGDAWIVAMYLIALGLAIVAGGTLVDTDSARGTARLELLCLALLVAALISAGIGFAQWAGVQRLGIFGADLPPGGRPFANFGQPNHWCTASLIGLAAAWVLYEARRMGGWSFGLVAAMLLTAMVVSGSRTAWLHLALGALIVWGLHRRVQMRLRPVALMAAMALVGLAWFTWPLLMADVGEGGVRSAAEQAQAGVRLPLWAALLDAVGLRPWVGYGWNQMVLAQQAAALEGHTVRLHFEHAHNLVLDLLLWVGVPLALVIIGVASWTLWRLVRGLSDARAAGLLLIVGAVLAHSMVEFAIHYAYFLLPLGLALGAAHRLAGSSSWELPAPVVRLLGVALLGLLAVTALDYQEADSSYRTLRFEAARVGADRIESPAPDLKVLTQLEAFLAYARQTPAAGASEAELASHARVAARFAYPSAQFRLAHWQAVNGDVQAATQTLQLICAMQRPALCLDVIDAWTRLQAEQPLLRAVVLPARPQ